MSDSVRVDALHQHRLADSWRESVVLCSCGWRTAERTMGKAKTEWVAHAQRHAAIAKAEGHQP